MADQNIEHIELKRCDLFKLSGRFDTSRAHEFDDALHEATDQGRFRLVLDLSETTYVSSGFLRVLVATAKSCRRFNRGNIYLVAPSQRIKDVLSLAGLTELFNVYDTPEEAVGAW